MSLFKKFISDEQGMESVEYAIVGVLITIASVLAFTSLGTAVAGQINSLAGTVSPPAAT